MWFQSEYDFIKHSGKIAVCSIFCCTSCNRNMEGVATLREKPYFELEWESSNPRRWNRRLISLYKIIDTLIPEYTRAPMPALHQLQCYFRSQDLIGRIRARTEDFESSVYLNCLKENGIIIRIFDMVGYLSFETRSWCYFSKIRIIFWVIAVSSAYFLCGTILVRRRFRELISPLWRHMRSVVFVTQQNFR